MASDAAVSWPAHVWHDCAIHGHVLSTGERCHSCDGGLGGCAICHQWEGDIVDQDRCIGVNPNTVNGIDKAMSYHYKVAPVLRPAKADDLFVGKPVVVWDFGAWQYPGEVVERVDATRFRVRLLHGETDAVVPLTREPSEGAPRWPDGDSSIPALAVYDPYNAVKN